MSLLATPLEPEDSGLKGEGNSLIAALFSELDDDDLDRVLAVARDGDITAGIPLLQVQQVAEAHGTIAAPRMRPDDSIADDFDDSQWDIVLQLRAICQDAIREKVSLPKRKRAIEWIFVPNMEIGRNRNPLTAATFNLACEALGARPWVIQALVQHIWYLRDIKIGQLPHLAVQLPEPLEQEAILRAWEIGGRCASLVWDYPGIERGLVVSSVAEAVRDTTEDSTREVIEGLDRLIDGGMLGLRGTRLYFTSRRPEIRKTGSIGWARSFV